MAEKPKAKAKAKGKAIPMLGFDEEDDSDADLQPGKDANNEDNEKSEDSAKSDDDDEMSDTGSVGSMRSAASMKSVLNRQRQSSNAKDKKAAKQSSGKKKPCFITTCVDFRAAKTKFCKKHKKVTDNMRTQATKQGNLETLTTVLDDEDQVEHRYSKHLVELHRVFSGNFVVLQYQGPRCPSSGGIVKCATALMWARIDSQMIPGGLLEQNVVVKECI